jgi:hypothetical protein
MPGAPYYAEAFSPMQGRCFRMVAHHGQAGPTHCSEPVAWRGSWRAPSGRRYRVEACSGLELLGWAVLQRHQWLTRDGLGRLPASGRVRLLLQWAGIPVELPTHLGALAGRRGRLSQPDVAGPELIFDVRNNLVHPPKRIDEPEWPDHNELLEAWQLATWYLELAVVRLLGYQGEYVSRLRLGRLDRRHGNRALVHKPRSGK